MRVLAIWILVAALAAPLHADTIKFVTGTELECKVVGDTPNGLLVILGNDNKGSMVLDRATIKEIIYDYDSRLAELRAREKEGGQPLYREHYDLGVWCEEHTADDPGMTDRALERYLHAKDKPDVPDDVFLRLGRMYEKCKEPNPGEAYAAYSEYLKRHPESAEAQSAVQRLAPQVQAQPAPTPTPTPGAGDEGLEVQPWRWERWSNPGSVQTVKDTGNKRTAVLELKYRDGPKDKCAYAYALNGDLAAKKTLLFDVYNPTKAPMRLAVAIVTGGNYEWYESRLVNAAPERWTMGADTMRFDLTLATWKSKKTNWVNNTKPDDLKTTRNIVILVYNGRNDGSIYIDNIRFEE